MGGKDKDEKRYDKDGREYIPTYPEYEHYGDLMDAYRTYTGNKKKSDGDK